MSEENENEGLGPATPGTAARCEDDLDLIASALGLTPYRGSNNRTIHEAEEAVSRLRAQVALARAEALEDAAKEVDLVAAEYIGQAGEAEFDPNWIAGESLQGAAERIRSLIPVADGAEGPRGAPLESIPEIERLKAENASLLESLREAEKGRQAATKAMLAATCGPVERAEWEVLVTNARNRAAAAEQEIAQAREEREKALATAEDYEAQARAAEQRNTALEGALRGLLGVLDAPDDVVAIALLDFGPVIDRARAALHDEGRSAPPPIVFWLAERPDTPLYRSADPQRTCGDVADVFRALRFTSKDDCETWIAAYAPGSYVAREHALMAVPTATAAQGEEK